MNIDIEDVYQELKAEEDLADALDLVVPYHPFYYGQVSASWMKKSKRNRPTGHRKAKG